MFWNFWAATVYPNDETLIAEYKLIAGCKLNRIKSVWISNNQVIGIPTNIRSISRNQLEYTSKSFWKVKYRQVDK